MNIWTQKSIQLANQTDYLDQLYKVYPMANNLKREISNLIKSKINTAIKNKDNNTLIEMLLQQTISKNIVFPIKDSYVAFLKHDNTAIARNPNTVNRIAGILYEMGYDEIIEKATQPKETNRQLGPLFNDWIKKGSLGAVLTVDFDEVLSSNNNIILDGSDEHRTAFAKNYLGYERNKGLDFLAKFNNKYIIGEAKFLSDFGGSQNSDFEDAEATLKIKLKPTKYEVIKIAIIDGVLYINKCSGRKPANKLRSNFNNDEVIISALLLRDYLYSV